jgi:serine/threonine-protein kinase HipA
MIDMPSMPGRVLVAFVNDVPVGRLQEQDGLWQFQYDPVWLDAPGRFPLSPDLPLQRYPILDGSSRRPVQWYFDNLLPEEGQRQLLARDARIDGADAFALLAYYGAESAGSLTLLPVDTAPSVPGGLRPLADADLSTRIRQLPRVSLAQGAVKRMSLAGAQHKLAVVLTGDELAEPMGARASTHILKPEHPDRDYPHSVANEWFVMRLARAMRLEVPDVQRRYVPEPVYLVSRFDRIQQEGDWQRRHVIDACQLLGLDRQYKYREGSIETLAQIARATRGAAVTRTRLFSWLVFNILTGNGDAHLKNLSFLVDQEGIRLAPHYDLVSTATWDTAAYDQQRWPNLTSLAWPVLGVDRFAAVNRELLLSAAQVLGIARGTAERLLTEQRDRIFDQALALLTQVEAENSEWIGRHPELAPTLTGEARCLRTIVHGVIRDMVQRL